MSLQGRDHPEAEVLKVFSAYLAIVEGGGDGEAFLRRQALIEPELRKLAEIDASLRVQLPASLFEGQAHSRNRFLAAVRQQPHHRRARFGFRSRFFGFIGALGLGLGLSGAVASGALPPEGVGAIFRSLPVVGGVIPESAGSLQERVVPAAGDRLEQMEPQTLPVRVDRPGVAGDATPSPAEPRNVEPSRPSAAEEWGAYEEGRTGAPSFDHLPPEGSGAPSGSPPAAPPPPAQADDKPDADGASGAPLAEDDGSAGETSGPPESLPAQGGENPGQGTVPPETLPGQGGEYAVEGAPPYETASGEGGEHSAKGTPPSEIAPGRESENSSQDNGGLRSPAPQEGDLPGLAGSKQMSPDLQMGD